ncbi:MAG TPA: hypothetical protein VMW25_04930 [Clostridia bacterium]|nr:hypothetical protein [Clostridia bacterium]
MNIGKTIQRQIVAPLQQWLLEQGRCVVCGQGLSKGSREKVSGGVVVGCSCGQQYFYLPKGKIYKRLNV